MGAARLSDCCADGPTPLFGDDAATVRVGWTVASSQTLSIVGSNGPAGCQMASTFVVPEPSQDALIRGHIVREDAVQLNAQSNTSWIVTARSESATMGTSFDGSYATPIRDLQVRVDGGAYVPLSPTGQIIARGTSGDETWASTTV